jgi:membrane-associated phospholipid phosphatase
MRLSGEAFFSSERVSGGFALQRQFYRLQRLSIFIRAFPIIFVCGIHAVVCASESGGLVTTPDILSHHPLYSPDTLHLDLAYSRGYFLDAWTLAASPARWKWSGWLAASLIAAGGAGLYREDRTIQTNVQRNRNRAGDAAASLVEPLGNGYYLVSAFGVFYLTGILLKNEKMESTTLLCGESVLIARGVTEVFKQGLHRYRPRESASPDKWNGPGISTTHLSFPSGHTTAAAALASALACRYQESPIIGIVAYTLAACTGLSRINTNAHWASDVFAGYVIGCYCGRVVARSHIRKNGVSLFPYVEGDRMGISLSFWR